MQPEHEILPAEPGDTCIWNGRPHPVLGWVRLPESGRIVPLLILSTVDVGDALEACERSTLE